SLLGKDIFDYYGLGCRNVSKLFLPAGYDHGKFFRAIFAFGKVMENNKYANNYEYNRTIYLMNGEKMLDNNFLVLREDISMHSPVGVLFFEYYSSEERLRDRLRMDAANIQCIVSKMNIPGAIPFGSTQSPMPWDYADGVDTMRFLLSL
ncbi:MAG TPA: acyl-CoA reductase, partial [Bacteroidia bacterium]